MTILCYTGFEQRQQSIEAAKDDLLVLAHSMAQVQKNIAASTKQILATLSLLPEVQTLNLPACREIFKDVLAQNSDYITISLTDPQGEVIASSKPFAAINLMDRKHVRDAITKKDFAVGEYIITRIAPPVPALAFAYPVLNKEGKLIAIMTTAITLNRFSNFHDISSLPEKSFVAITDHQGVRIFYYPPHEATNPVGKKIQAKSWKMASTADSPGTFITHGSDGTRRIFAFVPIRLDANPTPSLYVWAAIPESSILDPANNTLLRNLFIMLLATGLSLAISVTIAKTTLIHPITNLVSLTQEFAKGQRIKRSEQMDTGDEFGLLTRAFHDMADTLISNQKVLIENEARFRLVMDALDALVYVADMTTYEVLFVNKYGKKTLGDITGKICWQSIQQGQSGPCPFCTNKYLLNKDGSLGEAHIWEFQNTVTGQWFYMQDRAIRWIDGRIVRIQVATDITRRKTVESLLADESERLVVTLRSIGDGVITTDTDGRVLLINKVAETLTGWGCEEGSGRPLEEIFTIADGQTQQPCKKPFDRVLTSGEIIDLKHNTILISKSGQKRTIADSAAPIRDNNGNIIGMVLVFRDITEQLRTEQELLKVKKLESIGVLAGGIAHDFNNILAAILGNIDLSLMDPTLAERTRKLLKDAEKASWRARDLTQQLLTFAKGGQPIKEAAALAEVVKDSADFILRGGKVACRYEFPDDLWLVDIDKGQISQVVQNIILNASNAMPGGGVIEVSCVNVSSTDSVDNIFFPNGPYVKMTITDSGVGIAPDLLDKIFDPYFSTKQQGSGLGLAITHSIVSKHGGHISAQSTLGVGTTFTVCLPASKQTSATAKESTKNAPATRKSTILVMDDEESVLNITKEFLELMGHQVLLAQNGTEAIEIYKETTAANTPIDLTIMDLTIPGGMGGTDAVQQVLAIDPQAKVIVSSGYSNNPVMADFKDYGFCAAISKPYRLSELKKVINQILV